MIAIRPLSRVSDYLLCSSLIVLSWSRPISCGYLRKSVYAPARFWGNTGHGEVGPITSTDGSTTAIAVANTFLDIQDSDTTNFPRIDQMKIQKLVYYAHAWWRANTDLPLFGDDVEAWPWGPVVRNVYMEFKDCGRGPITNRGTEMVRTGPNFFDFQIKKPDPVPESVLSFLRRIWSTHKSLTGVQLSNATHASGEPWDIVREQYGSLDGKPRIPNDLIRDVFKAKRAKSTAT